AANRVLLKGRCPNETIDDAGAFIDELLAAHPDIAARDFLTHPGKPDPADTADADVVAEEIVRDLRLDRLDGLREQSCLGLAELLLLDTFPAAAAQAGLVKHEVGFGVGDP